MFPLCFIVYLIIVFTFEPDWNALSFFFFFFFIGCTLLPPLWSSSTRHPGGDALIGALHTFFPSASHFPPQCLLLTAAGTPPARSDLTPPRSHRLNPAPRSWKSHDFDTNPDPMCHYIRELLFCLGWIFIVNTSHAMGDDFFPFSLRVLFSTTSDSRT